MGSLRFFAARNQRQAGGEIRSGVWTKSSLSVYTSNCVEVTGLSDEAVRVRDSKNPKGAVLSFTPAEWDAFVGGVLNGEFNRRPRG